MINNSSSDQLHSSGVGGNDHTVQRNRRVAFGIMLFVVECIVIVMFGVFIRVKTEFSVVPGEDLDYRTGYPFYQDVNVMMLIGFGFLMTFIKTHQWSALSYTFLINAVVVQLYLLLQPFWHRILHEGWEEFFAEIGITSFTGASYCVASMLIAFGGILGRAGALELLVMSIVGTIGYTLNEDIIYNQLKLFDAGGSTAIHTYGAYFGLAVSVVITKMQRVVKGPTSSSFSNTIAVLGTFFLWMFWPSFNAGYFPTSPVQRALIMTNTVCALTGSCLSAFVISSFLRQKFDMEDILNATLAGGVTIGASSGLITNSTASLTIGFLIGAISTYGFARIGPKLNSFFGLEDTCGIHNLHGIPGILGGIISAIVVGSYTLNPLADEYKQNLPFSSIINTERTYAEQAGAQLAGTGVSLGLGIVFGFVAGIIISFFYKSQASQFFDDKVNFQTDNEYEKLNMDSTVNT